MNELEKLQQELKDTKEKLESSSRINSELKEEKKAALEQAAAYKAELQTLTAAEEERVKAKEKADAEAAVEAEIQKRVEERLKEKDNKPTPTEEQDQDEKEDPVVQPKDGELTQAQKRLIQGGLNL